jgi:hypothetical protein
MAEGKEPIRGTKYGKGCGPIGSFQAGYWGVGGGWVGSVEEKKTALSGPTGWRHVHVWSQLLFP